MSDIYVEGFLGGPLEGPPEVRDQIQSLTVYMKGDGMWSAGYYAVNQHGYLEWHPKDENGFLVRLAPDDA